MLVEIYEIVQTDEESDAEDQERQELIKILELEGKQESVNIPFHPMSLAEERVWLMTMHSHQKYQDFMGYIPTRVMRVIKTWKNEFKEIEIWSDRASDPILIGILKDQKFLMARWAEAMVPFEELRTRAIESYKKIRRSEIETKSSQVDADAEKYFNGEWVSDCI